MHWFVPYDFLLCGNDGARQTDSLASPRCLKAPCIHSHHQVNSQMCILAGCDFLKAIPGIGIRKAHAHMRQLKSFVRVSPPFCGSGNTIIADTAPDEAALGGLWLAADL